MSNPNCSVMVISVEIKSKFNRKLIRKRVMKNYKMSEKNQGKIREKSGNLEVEDMWQPC